MRKLRMLIMIVALALVSCGAITTIIRFAQGEELFFSTATFTEFFVCEGPEPGTGIPKPPITTVPSSAETVYACGYLEADGKVYLYFLLFHEGQPTGWFDPDEKYETGYVFKELPHSWREPGAYRVEVRLGRRLLASTEFTLVP